MTLFDPDKTQKNLQRALLQYSDQDRFLYRWAEKHIQDRLKDIKREFSDILLISDFPIDLGSQISQQNSGPYDCVISLLNLHRIEDPEEYLKTIYNSLKPDGLFIGVCFGEKTLQELKQSLINTDIHFFGGCHQRISPFITKQQMGSLIQKTGFSLPVIDSEYVHVEYKELSSLYDDLRAMGETNSLSNRSRKHLPKLFFEEVEKEYKKHFFKDRTFTCTYDLVFCIGWSPHESQQTPLRPGSGQVSLKDIL